MNKRKECIIVNAVALDRSGALTILKQFIENIPESGYEWLIFISSRTKIESDKPYVTLKPINISKNPIQRLLWDIWKLNKWIKRNGIIPVAKVSLQNTGFRLAKKDIPSFIYYHQPLPFYKGKWDIFNKNQRVLWIYKNLYPFFIKAFLDKKTIIFVQLNYIKEGFVKKFKHSPNLVEVYHPSLPQINHSASITTNRKFDRELALFYPAAPYFYKNHELVIHACQKVIPHPKLFLTTKKYKDIKNIESLGTIEYSQICQLYQSCDALVFPSYIETYGLPLIEAATYGMPIIAPDLPYAKEVLEGYKGVEFIANNEPDKWAEAIQKLTKGKRYKPIDTSTRKSWSALFESIISHISKKTDFNPK